MLKKLFVTTVSLLSSVAVLQAGSISFTVAGGGITNLNAVLIPGGPVRVTQVIAASDATHSAAATLVDNGGGTLTNIVAGYTNFLQLYTNSITSFVNYFGTTNYFTNIAQLTITNGVAPVTNASPVRYSLTVPTNSSIQSSGSYFFYQGLTLTNGGSGTGTYTITFQQ